MSRSIDQLEGQGNPVPFESSEEHVEDYVQPVPIGTIGRFEADSAAKGGEWTEPEEYAGSVGRTMFDTPSSEDNSITVLLPRDQIAALPIQSLVRIDSVGDKKKYLGVVTKGPFAEPDGIRGDSPVVVVTSVKGIFMPQFHGRVQVEILGEQTSAGIVPPRYRPFPNSPVFPLQHAETGAVLHIDGDIKLGLAVGHDDLSVGIPSASKAVWPRHAGIIGTTGGGKSTTVSGLVDNFQRAKMSTIILDVEGEYTELDQPTQDPKMQALLKERGQQAHGVAETTVYSLHGRETTNPSHPRQVEFCLQFSNLSPYLVIELLELVEAQQQRYLAAYDATKRLLKELKIFPRERNDEDDRKLVDLDELETGYPRMVLNHIYEIVRASAYIANKKVSDIFFQTTEFHQNRDRVIELLQAQDLPSHYFSWLGLLGKLGKLKKLNVFDTEQRNALSAAPFIKPGAVSIIDLSDTDSVQLRNLVIAELLRQISLAQEAAYEKAVKETVEPPRTMIIVEEAHEFLSTERIRQMPVLFQQVARIARRGRKRWLGLMFVTQLPQHLPDEVLGLINNYVLHKIADSGVISRLKRSVGGIDDSLWNRLPSLAPGQAVVSMASMTRPLLVAIDPSPCKLRMIE